jgi:hypothetical protein
MQISDSLLYGEVVLSCTTGVQYMGRPECGDEMNVRFLKRKAEVVSPSLTSHLHKDQYFLPSHLYNLLLTLTDKATSF